MYYRRGRLEFLAKNLFVARPLNDPLKWLVAVHMLQQRPSKHMLSKYLNPPSPSLELTSRSHFYNPAIWLPQPSLVAPSSLQGWNGQSSMFSSNQNTQHSSMAMFVIGVISSQGFGYNEREECKDLMVFGSHKCRLILSNLK